MRVQLGRYPFGPGYKDEGAGRDAAKLIAPKVQRRRELVLSAIGSEGITSEEIADRLGMSWYLVRPRVSDLFALGLVMKTGERGPSANGATSTRWRISTDEERSIFNARKAAEAEKNGGGQ